MKDGGFFIGSNDVVRNPLLSPQAKAVYALLCSYCGQDEVCWPSEETIAKQMGCTVRTVNTYLRELKEHKIVNYFPRGVDGVRTKNVYLIKDGGFHKECAASGVFPEVFWRHQNAVKKDRK